MQFVDLKTLLQTSFVIAQKHFIFALAGRDKDLFLIAFCNAAGVKLTGQVPIQGNLVAIRLCPIGTVSERYDT
ncbi:hypothetical protein E4T56_gene11738 [Termitomyces sp. T112]|nr:hypothetical protein E4T56_gene11738 [Termitomyces sp. T112]